MTRAGLPAALLREFAAVVGETHVLTGHATAGYAVDWTGGFAGHTPAVLRPRDTAEVAALLAEKAILDLQGPVLRVTGYDVPYPYWQLEDAYIPSVERVCDAARKLLDF